MQGDHSSYKCRNFSSLHPSEKFEAEEKSLHANPPGQVKNFKVTVSPDHMKYSVVKGILKIFLTDGQLLL
jgi:hypothetical protein